MKTREKIQIAAIELFNEKGATNVSTVQLSEYLKISPGNLYYYYENKEHLIRSIWEEIILKNTDMLFQREDFRHSENGILNFFDAYAKSIYKYRFYYTEIYSLLNNDEIMYKAYKERYINLINQLELVFSSWEETGISKTLSPIEKRLMAKNLWTVTQSSFNSISLLQNTASQKLVIKDLVLHSYAVISAALTDDAIKRMLILLKKKDFISEEIFEELEK